MGGNERKFPVGRSLLGKTLADTRLWNKRGENECETRIKRSSNLGHVQGCALEFKKPLQMYNTVLSNLVSASIWSLPLTV